MICRFSQEKFELALQFKRLPRLGGGAVLIPLCVYLLLLGRYGQGEEESSAYIVLTFDPDLATVAFYRNFAECKANPQSPGFMLAAQTSEFVENAFPIQNRDAGAIIFY